MLRQTGRLYGGKMEGWTDRGIQSSAVAEGLNSALTFEIYTQPSDFSPVHARLKRLNRVQVDVSIVPAHGKDPSHHRSNANSTPGRCELSDVLPAVGSGIEALH